MAATLGLDRVVFVQASPYGADNRCMLEAMREVGPSARMVCGMDEDTTAAELLEMDRLGVRGVRLNAASRGLRDTAQITAAIRTTTERIAPLGWHLQIFTDLLVIKDIAPVVRTSPIPVVFDHMGLAKGTLGIEQPGFPELCDLVANHGCWVKLSAAYRVSSAAPGFEDAAPIARALIDASPDRCIWGTDWPHTGKHGHAPGAEAPPIDYQPLDDGKLLDLLPQWTQSENMIERILVRNPARLYGFPSDVPAE